MIRAIVWKELREQGLIALSLVVLGSGVLAAAAAFADPPVESAPASDVVRFLGAGRLATLMLAVTAGMVCGGAVFAAERESGTMAFLESLPASRWRLWRAKLAAGAGLAAAQVGLLVAVAAALGLVSTLGWAFALAVYAMLAFAWGLFGSTIARTTLGSVGLAIPAAVLTGTVVFVPVLVLFQNRGTNMPRPTGAVLFLACMFVIPVARSAWSFTRADRDRAAEAASGRSRSRLGLAALQWLAGRQVLVPGLVISGFALVAGLSLLAPGIQPVLVWPELALMAGVLAGVTTFADEQTRGVALFWGEQRLPLGRMWLVKVGLHLVFCLWLLVLLAAPLVIQAQFRGGNRLIVGHTTLAVVFHSPLLGELERQGWKYVFLPAAYGFAAGHLAGLVFRKLVVACGVAVLVGGAAAAAWVPSLLSGGVHHWQVWLPPAVALLTSRLLMRAWTADRLTTRAPLGTLVGGCAATALVLGVGVGYRVVEVPDRPGGEDDIGYVAGLLPFDQNLAGRDFRTAAERYVRAAAAVGPEFEPRGNRTPGTGGRSARIEDRLERVIVRGGWRPADVPELGDWLDKMFAPTAGNEGDPWYAVAESASRQPVGIYQYPQAMTVGGTGPSPVDNAQRMAVALVGRGLQRQAAGDPAAMVPALRTTLALAANLRNGAGIEGFRGGNNVERLALAGVDRWLGVFPAASWAVGMRAVGTPTPAALFAEAYIDQVLPPSRSLREAIALLEAADPTGRFDPTPYFLAERYALRESQKVPGQWLPQRNAPETGPTEEANNEAELVALGWAVPWERERTRRLVGLGYEAGPPNNYALLAGRPGTDLLVLRARGAGDLSESGRALRGYRRAAILKLALHAFKADRGAFPGALEELVTQGYLRKLPADQYDDTRPLGYKVSQGETLYLQSVAQGNPVLRPGGPPANVTVPVGQAILWSVGPDRVGQHGMTTPAAPPGEDLIYLVPIGFRP